MSKIGSNNSPAKIMLEAYLIERLYGKFYTGVICM